MFQKFVAEHFFGLPLFPKARLRLHTAIGRSHDLSDILPAYENRRVPDLIYPGKYAIFETNDNLIIL